MDMPSPLLRRLSMNTAISTITRNQFCAFGCGLASKESGNEEFLERLLDRRWMLATPEAKIHQVKLSTNVKLLQNKGRFGHVRFSNNMNPSFREDVMAGKDQGLASFYVLRDDLLHPLINGNKARKLDALLPVVEEFGATDVVTCGGCQSAHTAAVAVSCAERGLKSHLLLRGEQPEVLTGYNLISTIYGSVSYIPRSLYAKRDEMLQKHAEYLAGECGSVTFLSDILEKMFDTIQNSDAKPMKSRSSLENLQKKVVIVNEGAGDAVALLGLIRLVSHLSRTDLFAKKKAIKLVVDAGTGTTAVGLALGALCLGLPWEVTAIMLADSMAGYAKKEKQLVSDFKSCFGHQVSDLVLDKIDGGVVHWVERGYPRKFGKVLEGEVEACQKIAKETGISVDPVYTLAAWELAVELSQTREEGKDVVMLHTGGTLGMFGLAQRYKAHFSSLKAG